MSTSTNVRAAALPASALRRIPLGSLCGSYIEGFCRRGEQCPRSHEICITTPDSSTTTPTRQSTPNYLSLAPRGSKHDKQRFDDDGPGELSAYGPRHDNDHVNIKDIKILPTIDEILSRRVPYMPKKGDFAPHHLPLGQERLLDVQFRQLRYDSIEGMVGACYHASQELLRLVSEPRVADYDYRLETPRGFRYSLFRYVSFEEVAFNFQKGVTLRMSFACPPKLRGSGLGPSKHLEEGMLVALIGYDEEKSLSATFMEVVQRQTTIAMRTRTGNDLRASAVLSFGDKKDVDAVRRMLYNYQGLLQEQFVLVDIPNALYAGFFWTLKNLQSQSQSDQQIAFLPSIGPSTAGTSPELSVPDYTKAPDFQYKLDVLRKDEFSGRSALTLRPQDFLSNDQLQSQFIETLCQETTLDHGQAYALCENLCRGLAFTQGPPGTGKSFLGSSLIRVLLASRSPFQQKPILVVCMTNHALDSFLDDLRKLGVPRLVRLGGNSKESWTKEIQISTVSRNMKRTTFERSSLVSCGCQTEGLITEGISWCESLNTQSMSWPAVREHLKKNYPTTLQCFTALEQVGEATLADIRLARKAGGFAFEYWCDGNDLQDIDQLLAHFQSLLGATYEFQDEADDSDMRTRSDVLDKIYSNINKAIKARSSSTPDVWVMTMNERQALLQRWTAEIEPQTISDRTAEIHRRHQEAVSRRYKVLANINVRCLEKQNVIGLTTTACAMHWPTLNQLGLQIVICEEAGEVMEAQTLCTLFPSVQHAISIGDPLQLRPQVNEQSLSLESDLGATYRLDESLMERMMIPSTPGVDPVPFSRLSIQRRMHPDIADLMRATLYPYLEDHESTRQHAPVAGMTDRVWWLNHSRLEDKRDSRSAMPTSFSNAYEVEMVVGLVEYLVNSNEYNLKDITVLTPYNGQLAAFTERLTGTCSLWLSDKDRATLLEEEVLKNEDGLQGSKTDVELANVLKLATIDNFQGEESKVVILSTVRSNLEGSVGFLKTSNRINVGCSRARDGFYIIGNATVMGQVNMWSQIVGELRAKSMIGPAFRMCCSRHPTPIYQVRKPTEWNGIPECQIPCGSELPCGHICTLKCHAVALHDRISCPEPCTKHHEACGHKCTKSCGQPCGDCAFPLKPTTLPCGHQAMLNCGEDEVETDKKCTVSLEPMQLPCGHKQQRTCSTMNEVHECLEKCDRILRCGHHCCGECHGCTSRKVHPMCSSSCGKELDCGHSCASSCHIGKCPPCQQRCQETCPHGRCERLCGQACDPCAKVCTWTCVHHGACTTMCCLPCNRIPCSEPCIKTLSCGHLCPSLCGEACLSRCVQCHTGKMPAKIMMGLQCGHTFGLEHLDNLFGLAKIYNIDSTGRISNVRLTSIQQLPVIDLSCPECGKACKYTRRYAILDQLANLEGNIDRTYGRFHRRYYVLLNQVYQTKTELDQTIQGYANMLRAGPLKGPENVQLTRDRGNKTNLVERAILAFRGIVIHEHNKWYLH